MTARRTITRFLLASVLSLTVLSVPITASAATDESSITGVAADTDGTRLPQVDVRLFSVGSDGSWAYRTKVTTSSTGAFTFDDLTAGRYVLQLVDQRPTWDTSKHVTTDVEVTAVAHATTKVTALMKRGAWLYGKVTYSTKKRKAGQASLRAVRDGDTTGTVYAVTAALNRL